MLRWLICARDAKAGGMKFIRHELPKRADLRIGGLGFLGFRFHRNDDPGVTFCDSGVGRT